MILWAGKFEVEEREIRSTPVVTPKQWRVELDPKLDPNVSDHVLIRVMLLGD